MILKNTTLKKGSICMLNINPISNNQLSDHELRKSKVKQVNFGIKLDIEPLMKHLNTEQAYPTLKRNSNVIRKIYEVFLEGGFKIQNIKKASNLSKIKKIGNVYVDDCKIQIDMHQSNKIKHQQITWKLINKDNLPIIDNQIIPITWEDIVLSDFSLMDPDLLNFKPLVFNSRDSLISALYRPIRTSLVKLEDFCKNPVKKLNLMAGLSPKKTTIM